MSELEEMRVFAAIARASSITRAAAELGLPKQTVSRRLAELEERLGVELARRTTRAFTLTAQGRSYAARCDAIVSLAREADAEASLKQHEFSGRVRVASDPVIADLFLAPVVNEFLRLHHHVQLEVSATGRFVDPREGDVDVVLAIGYPREAGLRVTSLGPAQVRFCASPAYLAARGTPQSVRDLAKHECIDLGTREAPFTWPFTEGGKLRWRRVKGRARLGTLAMLRSAALAGLGITILPAFAVVDDLASGDLVAVLDDNLPDLGTVDIVLASRSSPTVETFAAFIAQRLREKPAWVVPGLLPRPRSIARVRG